MSEMTDLHEKPERLGQILHEVHIGVLLFQLTDLILQQEQTDGLELKRKM